MPSVQQFRRGGTALLLALLVTGTLVAAVWLLYIGYCAFLDNRFSCDYAIYFNMLWNTAHGDWFRYYEDQNYLLVHLSFSLALLAPLLRLARHPFALSVIQWLLLMAGGILLLCAARRHRLSWRYALAALLYLWGWHFTQATQTDEFHGVAAYYLLIPALYFCACHARRWVWLPFVLLLGLREDAALMVVPLLALLAWRMRWRAGWWYAAMGLVYTGSACLVLYQVLMQHAPTAHNLTFVHPPAIFDSLRGAGLRLRAWALLWTVLPMLPLLLRGAPTAGWPVALPLLISLASASHYQYALSYHYGAVVAACVGVGLVEAGRTLRDNPAPYARHLLGWMPVWLLLTVTLSNAVYWNWLWPQTIAPKTNRARINPEGLHALRVARDHVPPAGLLLTSPVLASFTPDRRRLTLPETTRQNGPDPEVVFCTPGQVLSWKLIEPVRQGVYGVLYYDGWFIVLARGAATNANARFLRQDAWPALRFANCHAHGAGVRLNDATHGPGRYWPGTPRAHGPCAIAFGRAVDLEPGRYVARMEYRADPPRGPTNALPGELLLRSDGDVAPLVRRVLPATGGTVATLPVEFSLATAAAIEPQVIAQDAALWIYRISFEKLSD
jgi:uncharacterized membrane protein